MRRGLGEVNGLVNGQGRINGLLDHRGFINGSTVREARLPVRQLLPRYVAVAASLLLLFHPFRGPQPRHAGAGRMA